MIFKKSLLFLFLQTAHASHRSIINFNGKEAFDKTLSQGKMVFVNYGTSWCNHCHKMQPEWEELVELTGSDYDVVIAQVDCMLAASLCIDQSIESFPTLILYEAGDVLAKYPATETRAVTEFTDFIDQFRNPMGQFDDGDVVVLDDKSFTKVIQGDQMSVVFYHISWCAPCNQMKEVMQTVAKKTIQFNGDIRIASVDCGSYPDVCYKQNITAYPTYVMYRDEQELPNGRLDGVMSTTDLVSTVRKMVDEKPMQKRRVSFYGPSDEVIQSLIDPLIVPIQTAILVPESGTDSKDNEPEEDEDTANTFGVSVGTASKCRENLSMFDGTKGLLDTGCWEFDPLTETCHIRNPSCLVLDCLSDRMSGFIRRDAFNDPSIIDEKTLSLTREVQFNGNDGELCTAEFEYSAERDGIIFDIRLGECGMSAESVEKDDNKYIKFSQHFSFAQPPPNDFRIFFQNYFSSHFGFHCYYTASTTTADSAYSVSTKIYNSDIEKYVNWDSTFDLEFFADTGYSLNSDPSNLFIGDTLYIRASWRQDFSVSFPVEFYIDSCTISSADNASFDVIEGGCLSSLVQSSMHSAAAYQTKFIDFSYVSFSFVQHQARYDMRLQCRINFCLKFDRQFGNCGIPSTCPTGYFQP